LPLLRRIKDAYLLWHGYHLTLPKAQRHTLGQRIDDILIEIIEAVSAAQFLSRGEKLPFVRFAIKKTDTLKVLLMVLWESKSLDGRRYAALSTKVEEFGRMLGGWHGQIQKQNSPGPRQGKK
jgi:hypothetical protein